MSNPLDTSLQMGDVALQVGGLVLKCWQMEKMVRILEARLAELEPPPASPPPTE